MYGAMRHFLCWGAWIVKARCFWTHIVEHLLRYYSGGTSCLYGLLWRSLPPIRNTDTALLISCGHCMAIFWTKKPLVVSWISLFRWAHTHPALTQQQGYKDISETLDFLQSGPKTLPLTFTPMSLTCHAQLVIPVYIDKVSLWVLDDRKLAT